MSKERELLKNTLSFLVLDWARGEKLYTQIEQLLAQPETEREVILRGIMAKRFNEGLKVGQEAGNKAILEAAEAKQSYLDENERLTTLLLSAEDKIQELLAQPEQEPMSDFQIWRKNSNEFFEDGVRFAEKHYKIVGKNE